MGSYVTIPIFTGFPLLNQAKTIFVVDITKNRIAFAAGFLAHGFDERKKGLRKFQLLVLKYLQDNSDNNHYDPLFIYLRFLSLIFVLSGLDHSVGHPSHLMDQRSQACVIGVIFLQPVQRPKPPIMPITQACPPQSGPRCDQALLF